MKTKKRILTVCIIAGVIVLCIAGLLATAGIMSAKGYGISVGRLYLSDTGFYLVDEDKAMLMSDQSDNRKLFDGLNTGDLILVIHDGVDESYPSGTGAYRGFRLRKGNENDLPENLDIGVVKIDVTVDKQPELVRHSRGYANISLRIPDSWEYDTEDREDSNEFCIAFWPAGESEGKLRVWYYDFFGVCGTGLEQEKITLGNYEAYKGTYDNGNIWSFISLAGTPGDYVIINDGADKWWSEYGDEAMQILSTVVVGENAISEADAIAMAEKNATVEYNEKWASFDAENGYWSVTLHKGYIAGDDQVFTITNEGEIVDIKYGE